MAIRARVWIRIGSIIAAFLAVSSPVGAAGPADLCRAAARETARAYGIPPGMLLALSLTETGRAGPDGPEPWPWAVNLGGRGFWFASAGEARAFALARIAEGRRNIDLGCFQVNYRWHGRHFTSPEAMIDPGTNARYAAAFLTRLRDEFGSWERAVGAYHSRNPAHSGPYVERYLRHYRRLAAAGAAGDPEMDGDLADVARHQPATPGPSTAAIAPRPVPWMTAEGARAGPGSLMARSAAAVAPLVAR